MQSKWEDSSLPILLIFDNCEDESLLDQWRPRTGNCRILITSRRSEWSLELDVEVLPINGLSRDESVALLCRFRQDLLPTDSALDRISDTLGDHPLALHVAGNYLREYRNDVMPDEYLKSLVSVNIVNHPAFQRTGVSRATGHELNIPRTFEVSMRRLQKKNEVDRFAHDLLRIACCFAPEEPIPRGLLFQALTLSQTKNAKWVHRLWPSTMRGRQYVKEDALKRLANLGMVMERKDGQVVIHRLVAAYVNERKDSCIAVEATLFSIIDELNLDNDRRDVVKWQSHLNYIVRRALESPINPRVRMYSALTAERLSELGEYLIASGNYEDAAECLEFAMLIYRQMLGSSHKKTLLAIKNYVVLLISMNRDEDALQRASESLVGSDAEVADLLSQYGYVLYKQSNFLLAQRYLRAALKMRKGLSIGNLNYIVSDLRHLCLVLMKLGDLESVREYLQQYQFFQNDIDPKPISEIIRMLNELGDIALERLEIISARAFYTEAMAKEVEITGDSLESLENTITLEMASKLSSLGAVHISNTNITAALRFYDHSLRLRREVLDRWHPLVARSLNNLGNIFYSKRDLITTQLYYEQSLSIFERCYGSDHFESLIVRQNLAQLLAEMALG